MGIEKPRKVFGFFKVVASVGKALLRNFSQEKDSFSVEVWVLQFTSHRQSHIDDRALDHLLLRVSDRPESVPSLVDCISRCLYKTRDHVVALKTLFLIHRILQGNIQIHIARAFSDLQLGCCWFMRNQDPSSAFLRNYAYYLQERVVWIMNEPGNRLELIRSGDEKDGEEPTNPLFPNLSKFQEFIDKVLNFTTINTEIMDNLVQVALCTILKESFQVYKSYSGEMKELRGKLSDLSKPERALGCEMLRKAAKQSQDLRGFYEKCRECLKDKSLEYPSVEAINMEKWTSRTYNSSL